MLALVREPRLEVVLHRRRVVQCARDDRNDAVPEAERLVELLRVHEHFLEHRPAARRVGDAELLDLFKLVHAENAPRVLAVRARLLAEARRVARVPDRELLARLFEPLARVHRRDRLLRRRDQVLVLLVADDLVQLLVKVLELGGARHRLLAHDERRHHLLEALAAQKVEAVVDQRLVQVDAVAHQVEAAMPRDLRAALRVKELEAVHHLVVREDALALLERRIRAVGQPRTQREVVVLGLRDRHAVADDVRDRARLGAHRLLGARDSRLELGDACVKLLLVCELRVRVLLVLLLGGNRLLRRVHLLLEPVELELERRPVLVHRQHLIDELRTRAAAALRLTDDLGVAALLNLQLE